MNQMNRRILLTASSALLVGGGISQPALAARLDENLLAYAAAFLEADRELKALDVDAARPLHAHAIAIDDQASLMDAALERWWSAMHSVIDTPAKTPAGLRAKAEVLRGAVLEAVVLGPEYTIGESGDGHERLAWSLVNDIIGAA